MFSKCVNTDIVYNFPEYVLQSCTALSVCGWMWCCTVIWRLHFTNKLEAERSCQTCAAGNEFSVTWLSLNTWLHASLLCFSIAVLSYLLIYLDILFLDISRNSVKEQRWVNGYGGRLAANEPGFNLPVALTGDGRKLHLSNKANVHQ